MPRISRTSNRRPPCYTTLLVLPSEGAPRGWGSLLILHAHSPTSDRHPNSESHQSLVLLLIGQVPVGKFTITTASGNRESSPEHHLTLSRFHILSHPVELASGKVESAPMHRLTRSKPLNHLQNSKLAPTNLTHPFKFNLMVIQFPVFARAVG